MDTLVYYLHVYKVRLYMRIKGVILLYKYISVLFWCDRVQATIGPTTTRPAQRAFSSSPGGRARALVGPQKIIIYFRVYSWRASLAHPPALPTTTVENRSGGWMGFLFFYFTPLNAATLCFVSFFSKPTPTPNKRLTIVYLYIILCFNDVCC